MACFLLAAFFYRNSTFVAEEFSPKENESPGELIMQVLLSAILNIQYWKLHSHVWQLPIDDGHRYLDEETFRNLQGQMTIDQPIIDYR